MLAVGMEDSQLIVAIPGGEAQIFQVAYIT